MKKLMLVVLLCLPAMAHADAISDSVKKINTDLTSCMAKAESDADMNGCNDKAYSSADTLLNRTYNQMVKTLKTNALQDQKNGIPANQGSLEILKRMQDSEVAWIKFRDSDCMFQATQMLGGTGEGLVNSGCMVKSELDRVTELNQVVNGAN